MYAAVEIEHLSKSFRLYRERNESLKATVLRGRRSRYDTFWALRDVSLTVASGSTIGIVGSNGSGKSTLLKCMARILLPDEGLVRTRGTIGSLLELGSGFHSELTGRENIYLNASMLRIDRSLIDERIDDIVDFAGIGEFIDQPVKNYSSGMYVRLGFAVAVHIDPDILLIDEVLAVGDANFQDKCMQKFDEFRRRGKTIVLASHALGHLQTICDDVAQLDQGRLAGIRRAGLGSMSEPEPVEHVQPRTDSGARRVRITAVEVLDESGFAVERVQTGDEVAFRIHYAAAEPVDRPVFALALDSEAGVRAWAQHSRDAMLAPRRISGAGSIDLHIPRLLLQSGSYAVHASIGDDAISEAYDALPDAARLQVANHSLTESAGVAVLGGTWGNALSRQQAAHREAEQP